MRPPTATPTATMPASVAQRPARGPRATRDAVGGDPIAEGVAAILARYDAEPGRAGLAETPARVARMYAELLTPRPFTFTMFDAEGADQMVVVGDIPFYTLCEHHLIPFYGTAVVAYIPDQRLAGLSKLARAVDYFARRLQTQERLGNEVADYLTEQLEPQGVGVVLRATHLCMAMRGVGKRGATTTTSALRGALRTDASARAEFLSLAATYHGGGTSS